MKSSSIKAGNRAFTLLELFVVISTIALVVLLLLPVNHSPHKAVRINCTFNLKQVGLAFRMWADDNGVYPMLYRTNDFDGPSFAIQQKMFVYYQAMSNELSTPKIVVCPSDAKRTPGTNFTTDFNNSNVSYFVGLDANETNAMMFLAGDRHISNGTQPLNHLLDLKTNQPVSWTQEIHNRQGNVALADGSVQGFTSAGLQQALQNTGTNLTRLALP
jgi:prepilin-type processing-associated H-X9-DG protein